PAPSSPTDTPGGTAPRTAPPAAAARPSRTATTRRRSAAGRMRCGRRTGWRLPTGSGRRWATRSGPSDGGVLHVAAQLGGQPDRQDPVVRRQLVAALPPVEHAGAVPELQLGLDA